VGRIAKNSSLMIVHIQIEEKMITFIVARKFSQVLVWITIKILYNLLLLTNKVKDIDKLNCLMENI
jgi:hypothetical protein